MSTRRPLWLVLGSYLLLFSFGAEAATTLLADAKFKETMVLVAREEINSSLTRLQKPGMLVKEIVAATSQFAPTDADKKFIAGLPARYRVSGAERIQIKNLKRNGTAWDFSLSKTKITLDSAPLAQGKILINGQELSLSSNGAEEMVNRLEAILNKKSSASLLDFSLIATAHATRTEMAMGTAGLVLAGLMIAASVAANAIDRVAYGPKDVARFFRDANSTCQRESSDPRVAFANTTTGRKLQILQANAIFNEQGLPGIEDCDAFSRAVMLNRTQDQINQLGDIEQACQAARSFAACANRMRDMSNRIRAGATAPIGGNMQQAN